MFIYDSHCHLEHILGLTIHDTAALIPAVKLNDIINLAYLRSNYPVYKIGLGIHPWFIPPNIVMDELTTNLKQLILNYHPDFIGEIGLDYLKPNWEMQKKIFTCQLQLAKEFNLPVVVHCVKAYNEVLAILKQQQIHQGIIHGFNANSIIAKHFINIGFYLGIGSLITKNSLISKSITQIPLPKLVLESDAPFMPAFKQSDSTSLNTFLYAQIMAKKFKMNLIDLINQSNYNFKQLFRN